MKTTITWLWTAFAATAVGSNASTQPSLQTSPSAGTLAPATAGVLQKRYSGTYRYVGGEAQRAAVKDAVDSATEGMLGVDIARIELMKRQEIRPTYTITFDEKGNVSVETPGYPTECSPLDGTEVQLKTKYGDVVQNSQQFVDGALLQRGRTRDGSGSTQFKLQPDGNTLAVTRVSKSPKLPRAVEFVLTYVREKAP